MLNHTTGVVNVGVCGSDSTVGVGIVVLWLSELGLPVTADEHGGM